MDEPPAQENTLLAAIALRPSLFNGLRLDKSQQWWNSFSRYANFSQFRRETKAQLLGMLLTGSALLWFESLPEATQNNIDLLTAAFREKYIIPAANQLQHQVEALQCQQKQSELVEEFVAETKFKLNTQGYNENQQMTIILNGLRPEIKSVVMQHLPFDNFEQFVTKAKHVEQALQNYVIGNLASPRPTDENQDVKKALEELTANVAAMQQQVETGTFQQWRRGRGTATATYPQVYDAKTKRCYICNSPSHLQRQCLQNQSAPRRCFICGDWNHLKRYCPQTSQYQPTFGYQHYGDYKRANSNQNNWTGNRRHTRKSSLYWNQGREQQERNQRSHQDNCDYWGN